MKASVLVIGGGPAGSSAAWQLAKAGVDVLLVDKSSFPREKVCGDGLTPLSTRELELLGLRERIEGSYNAVGGCVFWGPGGSSFEAVSEHHGHCVPRKELDALLHRHACEAGARELCGALVTRIDVGAEGVQAMTRGGETLSAPIAIVATGSHSSLPHDLGLSEPPPSDAVARRGYFENVRWRGDRLLFCYAKDLLPGYGWVFPFGDGRANVGIGYFLKPGEAPAVERTWEQFLAWLKRQGFFIPETRPISSIGTAQLRMGFRRNRLAGERILLAGDAASAINPLSGEGVSQALKTGRLAAAAARKALETGDFSAVALGAYAETIRKEFPQVGSYLLAKKAFQSPMLVDVATSLARISPRAGKALYETIIGVLDPSVAFARCAAAPFTCWFEPRASQGDIEGGGSPDAG
jgi:geranylgeranyl reductase family protein